MKIVGFQKLSLNDYPGKVACIVFTLGCNYRCPYCHNSDLLTFDEKVETYSQEIFDYLEKRKGVIDAIVVSGGEPTLQPDLINYLKILREYKLLIKLDTNGSNPEILEQIIKQNLVDYVAMDIKNSFEKYEVTTGIKNIDLSKVKKSIELLKKGNVNHEFRTTIVKEFHDIEDIKKIVDIVGEDLLYIQNFSDNENVLYSNLHSFSEDELLLIKKKFPKILIRGFVNTDIKEDKNVSC